MTSPPYWGLRDYGLGDSGIGLERSIDGYLSNIVQVFREVKRVMRKDGTCWLNLGDTYARDPAKGDRAEYLGLHKNIADSGCHHASQARCMEGLKPKDLCGVPWRVAFALKADGWYLRSDTIWAKPNPMPESVTDRPTRTHEYIFLLTKSERYFYDAEAVAEDAVSTELKKFTDNGHDKQRGHSRRHAGLNGRYAERLADEGVPTRRNRRSVWNIATQAYSEAHYATFPEELVRICLAAGTSAYGCCPECGKPWVRIVERRGATTGRAWHDHKEDRKRGQRSGDARAGYKSYTRETLGWEPKCSHGRDPVPCLVLDPFGGSGTTGLVAFKMGLSAAICDLKYHNLARKRIPPMAFAGAGGIEVDLRQSQMSSRVPTRAKGPTVPLQSLPLAGIQLHASTNAQEPHPEACNHASCASQE